MTMEKFAECVTEFLASLHVTRETFQHIGSQAIHHVRTVEVVEPLRVERLVGVGEGLHHSPEPAAIIAKLAI
jgi:hypothetical protein